MKYRYHEYYRLFTSKNINDYLLVQKEASKIETIGSFKLEIQPPVPIISQISGYDEKLIYNSSSLEPLVPMTEEEWVNNGYTDSFSVLFIELDPGEIIIL